MRTKVTIFPSVFYENKLIKIKYLNVVDLQKKKVK